MKIKHHSDVDLIQTAASDGMVCKAARVSTLGAGEADTDPIKDRGLINFLMRDRHGSPFEHGSMTFRICAPIFVAREFMRHRAGMSFNEESARYRELDTVFFVPDQGRPLVQKGKPGAYHFEPGTFAQWWGVEESLHTAYAEAEFQYKRMLEDGVAREIARSVLPVGTFTTFFVTCNPRSLMHFLSLRTKHAEATFPSFPQLEIQEVAEKMEAHWTRLMPVTAQLFTEHGRVSP
ncbi:FAD-dependent thymidylate synthase [Streptomyces sp. BI20]|uniref:FAD-dependent thymidylate synthase n=1 Tax=Streptomyces sp. BI20 TaxID=3403460 RepID=UPI003C732C69